MRDATVSLKRTVTTPTLLVSASISLQYSFLLLLLSSSLSLSLSLSTRAYAYDYDYTTDAACADEADFRFRWKNKQRSCHWLSNVTNRKKKRRLCNKKKNQRAVTKVKNHCQSACNFNDCNNDNACVDDTEYRFPWKNKNKRSCKWLSGLSKQKRKKTKLCDENESNNHQQFCQSACNYQNCRNRKNADMPSYSPTGTSTQPPLTPSRSPSYSPTGTSTQPPLTPSRSPSYSPTGTSTQPPLTPSSLLTAAPVQPSTEPSSQPTPTTTSMHPSSGTLTPSRLPTAAPIEPGTGPSSQPTTTASAQPSSGTLTPSLLPTAASVEPSTEPSSQPTTSPQPPALFAGKKGVCFTLRDAGKKGSYVENLPKMRALNPHWVYSWGQKPAAAVPVVSSYPDRRGIQIRNGDNLMDFVPMLWGYYADLFERFTNDIRDQNPRVVLGFNEPDSTKQSNIKVEDAVEGWSKLVDKITASLDPDKQNEVLLVSPSAVHPTGIWFETFMDQIREQGIRVDAIGVHWYDEPNPKGFKEKLRKVYDEYDNRPLLITEFAVADWEAKSVEDNRFSPERVLEFMQVVLPWMEEQEWILGYSWFSFEHSDPNGTTSALFSEDDENNDGLVLTPLGEYYRTFNIANGGGGSSSGFTSIGDWLLGSTGNNNNNNQDGLSFTRPILSNWNLMPTANSILI